MGLQWFNTNATKIHPLIQTIIDWARKSFIKAHGSLILDPHLFVYTTFGVEKKVR